MAALQLRNYPQESSGFVILVHMKVFVSFVVLFGIAVIALAVWLVTDSPNELTNPVTYTPPTNYPSETTPTDASAEMPVAEVIAENLHIPWEILFLPNGDMVVTERAGQLVLLPSGRTLPVPNTRHTGEGGLLGAALHPDFAANNYLYLYQTTEHEGAMRNQIVRYRLRDGELTFDQTIIADLPGARYHDGGRITFGPDGYLYATVGDAIMPAEAQNRDTLEGTIIRITDAGEPAPGNPFGTVVYSYGHRNPQGLAWDEEGNLWSTEHGRSGLRSGLDELNLITPGGNYGWPESEGDEVAAGTIGPVRHSTAEITWAPGGLAYLGGSLYIPGLRGETLYEAVLDDTTITGWHEHFVGTYGRLRTVTVGPDGFLYLTTSNRDGRGDPAPTDDRIIRINPAQLER